MYKTIKRDFVFAVIGIIIPFGFLRATAYADDHPYPKTAKETKAPPTNNWGDAEEDTLDQKGKAFEKTMSVEEFISERKLEFENSATGKRGYDAPADIDGKWGPVGSGSTDDKGKFKDPQEMDYQSVADLAKHVGYTGTVHITHSFKQKYRVSWKGTWYELEPEFTRVFKFDVTVDGSNPNPTPTPSPTP